MRTRCPHKPLACSEEFYKKTGTGLYGDVLAELDHSVGQILAKLKELDLDRRTLVIFTSDNGPWYGGSTGGLRGMKGTAWEGGYRVPSIMRWPGRIPSGFKSPAMAVIMDLFATTLDSAGVSLPAESTIDGRSLLAVASGEESQVHDVVFGHQGNRVTTVRDGRWKLHAAPSRERRDAAADARAWVDPRGPDGVTILAPYEQHTPADYPGVRGGDDTVSGSLFDLSSDPAEQHDVAVEHPEQVERLKAILAKAVEAANATGRP